MVEGVGEHLPGAVRETHALEFVLREAGLADALNGKLDGSAAATLLAAEADVFVALPEVDGRREALPLGRLVLGGAVAERPCPWAGSYSVGLRPRAFR
jgi:hypothetical protein